MEKRCVAQSVNLLFGEDLNKWDSDTKQPKVLEINGSWTTMLCF